MKIRTLVPALLLAAAATGCATWDNLSSREKSAATGAVVSNGGILGTVGGAAIGGVIGDQVGKNK